MSRLRFPLGAALAIAALGASAPCSFLAGCDGPVATVDAGPSSVDAFDPASIDANRPPDAAEPADAARRPDAPRPRCEGAGCEIVELALGFETSCGRRGNGEVWCWGRGNSGELGDGASRHAPGCPRVGSSEITDCSSVAVQVALSEPAVRVYGQGGFSFCAETAGGDFHCWGSRGYVVTDDLMGDRLSPELTTYFHGARSFADAFIVTCWLDAAGAVSCVGDNSVGELGQGDFARRLDPVHPMLANDGSPIPLTGLVEIASSTTFGGTICGRSADQLYCWGQNDLGQMGARGPHTTCVSGIDEFDCSEWVVPIDFARTADIARLSMGSQHTCALLTDATAWCWGQNRNGELGLGTSDTHDTAARFEPTELTGLTGIAEIELGARHSCARLEDGSVWCWGSNDLGQLGDGVEDHPQAQCQNGDTLIDCSSIPVRVIGIDDATELDVGRQHSCVIRRGGAVWCWGNNDAYEASGASRAAVPTPVQVDSL